MPLLRLAPALPTRNGSTQPSSALTVDIVAVHGLGENMTTAWTDIATDTLWLRDLLPSALSTARVLTFGYNATATSFYGHASADRIKQQADTLVAELHADRSLEGCVKRPIIFICHGLGGILVKKALAYSSTSTSNRLEHLHSIFISTYAILFFGTPHLGTDKASWLAMSRTRGSWTQNQPKDDSQLLLAIQKDSETLQTVTEQFAPLMRQFHVFNFWEELPSHFDNFEGYVVEESSAAPLIELTQRSGISANHSQMVQFTDVDSSNYRTVLEALVRYCRSAPSVISRRWDKAAHMLSQFRSNEAEELTGIAFDVHKNNLPFEYPRFPSEKSLNRHFELPQVVCSFYTGREDIAELVAKSFFRDEATGLRQQKRFIIHGIGGSGKTQFCSKFAQDHRERFWGVFWIDATSTETAKQSFSRIGKLGGMEATESAGKHWLSTREEPWLLIVNNADDPGLHLQALFPEGERGHILVSTRNPDFRVHATVGAIEFKGLKKLDALRLLLRAAAIPEPWDLTTEITGNKITDTLGYLALALIQAGALVLQRICDIKDYLDFYQQHRQRLSADRRYRNMEERDQFTVYATWDLSLNSLEQRRTEASEDAAQLLNIVAFFHFEQIPVSIFIRAVTHRLKAVDAENPHSFLSRAWRAIGIRLRPPVVLPEFLRQESYKLSSYRIRCALHELHSFSLISYDGRSDTFSLHPLVHSWARDRLEKGLQGLWAHIALSVMAESILLPPNDENEAGKDFRRDILPHLDSCLNSNPIQIFDYNARFGGFKFPFALILQHTWLLVFREQVIKAAKCGYVYLERGRFHEAAVLLLAVKNALVASRGSQDESTMRATLALSGVYWGLGRCEEAVELQQDVVEARKKRNGPEAPETLCAMNELGRSFWLNGQYKAALDIQTLTTARMQAKLGLSHPDTLASMDNLGVTYGAWRRYTESKSIHQRVLDGRMSMEGKSDEKTLSTMNNLAMALKDLGELGEAKELMVNVHTERRLQLGREHPWTLWALCNLAKVDVELKNLKDAEEMLIPGIAAAKRSLGEDHLGVLMGEGELARVFARQGRIQEAVDLTTSLIPRMERSRGLSHPDTVYTLSKLAQLHEQLGNVDKAIELCTLAAHAVDDKLTKLHPLALDVSIQLSELKKKKHICSKGSVPSETSTLGSASKAQPFLAEKVEAPVESPQRLRKHETF